ncbi:MAG TPA: CRISPR-associated protein Csx19 [Candidatus Angelobacter sp.]|nr:CRISPR-associated protein Csx19 [Candidatus Angelobacter sp.]
MHELVQINPMSSEWLLQHAGDAGGTAVLLIQGHPATGFGRVSGGKIDLRLEPGLQQTAEDLPWSLCFDIRMFGDRGEWHCWRIEGSIWRGRFAGRDREEWQEKDGKAFARHYVLWGTKFTREGDWVRCSESRGSVVWVPAESYGEKEGEPAHLAVRERVEFDAETGIASVADAMILGFVGGSRG